uniref:RNA-dependent RNA polymerase n=1 Tax=Rhizoctonia cerealis beny-like virus TaxID=3068664 RepID=A0AA51BS87_9VIRU|nr:MAG: RNA-dependent RNA polymerase [Rhizoctonia cerealis beny-like virus]
MAHTAGKTNNAQTPRGEGTTSTRKVSCSCWRRGFCQKHNHHSNLRDGVCTACAPAAASVSKFVPGGLVGSSGRRMDSQKILVELPDCLKRKMVSRGWPSAAIEPRFAAKDPKGFVVRSFVDYVQASEDGEAFCHGGRSGSCDSQDLYAVLLDKNESNLPHPLEYGATVLCRQESTCTTFESQRIVARVRIAENVSLGEWRALTYGVKIEPRPDVEAFAVRETRDGSFALKRVAKAYVPPVGLVPIEHLAALFRSHLEVTGYGCASDYESFVGLALEVLFHMKKRWSRGGVRRVHVGGERVFQPITFLKPNFACVEVSSDKSTGIEAPVAVVACNSGVKEPVVVVDRGGVKEPVPVSATCAAAIQELLDSICDCGLLKSLCDCVALGLKVDKKAKRKLEKAAKKKKAAEKGSVGLEEVVPVSVSTSSSVVSKCKTCYVPLDFCECVDVAVGGKRVQKVDVNGGAGVCQIGADDDWEHMCSTPTVGNEKYLSDCYHHQKFAYYDEELADQIVSYVTANEPIARLFTVIRRGEFFPRHCSGKNYYVDFDEENPGLLTEYLERYLPPSDLEIACSVPLPDDDKYDAYVVAESARIVERAAVARRMARTAKISPRVLAEWRTGYWQSGVVTDADGREFCAYDQDDEYDRALLIAVDLETLWEVGLEFDRIENARKAELAVATRWAESVRYAEKLVDALDSAVWTAPTVAFALMNDWHRFERALKRRRAHKQARRKAGYRSPCERRHLVRRSLTRRVWRDTIAAFEAVSTLLAEDEVKEVGFEELPVGGSGSCWQKMFGPVYDPSADALTVKTIREAVELLECIGEGPPDSAVVYGCWRGPNDLHIYEYASYRHSEPSDGEFCVSLKVFLTGDVPGRPVPKRCLHKKRTHGMFMGMIIPDLCTCLLTPDHVVRVGAGAMELVEAAQRTFGADLGRGEAGVLLNNELASMPSVPYAMSHPKLLEFMDYVGKPVRCTQRKLTWNDHLFLEASRHLVREELNKRFAHNTDAQTVLHIGSTTSDLSRYLKHAGHDFVFSGRESKDVARVFEDVGRLFAQRVNELKPPVLKSQLGSNVSVGFRDLKQVLAVLERDGRQRVFYESLPPKQYNVLMFEDSLYTMSPDELVDAFGRTRATVGYATMFFPNKMVDPRCEDSSLYHYEEYWSAQEDWDNIIEKIWPSILLLMPLLPLPRLASAFEHCFRALGKWGGLAVKEWILDVKNDKFPFELVFATLVDLVKIRPIIDHIMARAKPLFRALCVRARVTWKGGMSNGYDHPLANWENWLKRPRIRGVFHPDDRLRSVIGEFFNPTEKSEEIFIDSEIVTRVGEMYLIRFWRSDGASEIVRRLELPDEMQYVEIAEVEKCYRRALSGIRVGSAQYKVEDLSYFSLRRDTWFKILNFAMAEPAESLTLGLILTAVNRLSGGLAVGSNVIVKKAAHDVSRNTDIALAVLLEVYKRNDVLAAITSDSDMQRTYESNISIIGKRIIEAGIAVATGGLALPICYIVKWLFTHVEIIEYVKYPGAAKPIYARGHGVSKDLMQHPARFTFAASNAAITVGCVVCDLYHQGRLSSDKCPENGQTFHVSKHSVDNKHDISIGLAENQELITRLQDAQTFHATKAPKLALIIAKVKEWAQTNEGGGMKGNVNISHVRGGPGTGKTELIKSLMYDLDRRGISNVMMTPIAKLLEDYHKTSVLGEGGQYDFCAETTWYTFKHSNMKYLIVDECTVADWLIIRAACHWLGVQELILVGDREQTHLRPEAGEGTDPTNPESGLDWERIPEHDLVYQYRLGKYMTNWCNRKHGYRMISKRQDLDKPIMMTSVAYNEWRKQRDKKGLLNKVDKELVFSHAEGEPAFGLLSSPDKTENVQNLSVRSSQGKTADRVAVSASALGERTSKAHGMLLVSVTRAKYGTIFVAPDSVDDPQAKWLREELYMDDEDEQDIVIHWPPPPLPSWDVEPTLDPRTERFDKILRAKAKEGEVVIEGPVGSKDKFIVALPPFQGTLVPVEPTKAEIDAQVDWGALADCYRDMFWTCGFDALAAVPGCSKEAVDRVLVETCEYLFYRDFKYPAWVSATGVIMSETPASTFGMIRLNLPLPTVFKDGKTKHLIPVVLFPRAFQQALGEDSNVVLETPNGLLRSYELTQGSAKGTVYRFKVVDEHITFAGKPKSVQVLFRREGVKRAISEDAVVNGRWVKDLRKGSLTDDFVADLDTIFETDVVTSFSAAVAKMPVRRTLLQSFDVTAGLTKQLRVDESEAYRDLSILKAIEAADGVDPCSQFWIQFANRFYSKDIHPACRERLTSVFALPGSAGKLWNLCCEIDRGRLLSCDTAENEKWLFNLIRSFCIDLADDTRICFATGVRCWSAYSEADAERTALQEVLSGQFEETEHVAKNPLAAKVWDRVTADIAAEFGTGEVFVPAVTVDAVASGSGRAGIKRFLPFTGHAGVSVVDTDGRRHEEPDRPNAAAVFKHPTFIHARGLNYKAGTNIVAVAASSYSTKTSFMLSNASSVADFDELWTPSAHEHLMPGVGRPASAPWEPFNRSVEGEAKIAWHRMRLKRDVRLLLVPHPFWAETLGVKCVAAVRPLDLEHVRKKDRTDTRDRSYLDSGDDESFTSLTVDAIQRTFKRAMNSTWSGGKLSDDQYNLATHWLQPTSSWKTVEREIYEDPVGAPHIPGGTDAFRALRPFIDPTYGFYERSMLNEPGVVRGMTRPTNAVINESGFWAARTTGGKIKHALPDKHRAIGVGLANHFGTSAQETLMAAERIGQLRAKPSVNFESLRWARETAAKAHREFWKPDVRVGDEENNEIIDRSLSDAMNRRYAQRADREFVRRFAPDVLYLQNKNQKKPIKNDKLDLFKTGQIIVSSPPIFNLKFISAMRSYGKWMKTATGDGSKLDDYEDPGEFRKRVSTEIQSLPVSVKFGVMDFAEFDSQQNGVTLAIEKELARLAGCSPEFIEEYYVVRSTGYRYLFPGLFKGRTNWEKGSGYLDTKSGNTNLSIALSHRILSDSGPRMHLAKGDDTCRISSNLHEDRQESIRTRVFTGMKWSLDIGEGGEFIGDSISRAGMYQSITRAAMKALCATGDYKKFKEQQAAYRNTVHNIVRNGLTETIACSAIAENKDPNYVEACFTFLNSLSHISEKQYYSFTRSWTRPVFLLPGADGPRLY